jgi:hypothetical protein
MWSSTGSATCAAMYKRDRAAFLEKIAPEPLWALYKLEELMRQTGQTQKLALVREEIQERRANGDDDGTGEGRGPGDPTEAR